MRKRTGAALVGSLIGLACGAATADEMFAGKTISVSIGSGPGGGYDFFARLASRHIGRHLPGNPTVTAQNMPGAGSIKAMNYLYANAPKDGTALALGTPSISLVEALKTPGVRFESAKFNWIGRVGDNLNVTYTWKTSAVKSVADAMTKNFTISGPSASSPITLQPQMLGPVLGMKIKLITGYADTAEAMVAAERGEVDGSTASWNTLKVFKQNWLTDGSINLLVQFGLKRHHDLPNVQAAVELARNEAERQLISLYVNSADVGYALAAPPGVPEDRVAALRKAFVEMFDDPQFKQDVAANKTDVNMLPGVELQKIIGEATNVPAAVMERARSISGPQKGE